MTAQGRSAGYLSPMSNRLGAARSAYLRAAADQPVHWYPWGAEPFERAAADGKPVLLDIGAAWCHWCHVMDDESYQDPAVAEFLNQHFVAIKVDRDERPDVDARYQRAVQALVRQGGWPLTAFLNARGEVFFGGTYFPPDGTGGRPGFLSVLRRVAHVYRAEPERVALQAAQLRDFVVGVLDEAAGGRAERVVLDAGIERILAAADPEHGGFGTEPKFPHPAAVSLLLDWWRTTGDDRARVVATDALDAMATGGFRDHLGGGFHRYATDRRWRIPHFEKLATDNAELLRCYVKAARMLGRPGDRDVVRDTVCWIRDTLADGGGGFGASQDADLGHDDDGSYFTWSAAELEEVLDEPERRAAAGYFGLDDAGSRMPHGPARSVLFLAAPIERVAAELGLEPARADALVRSAIDKLRAARARRTAPAVDPTRYAGWNAMLAAALLDAGLLLDDADTIGAADRAFRLLRQEQTEPDRVARTPGGEPGLLEDQVQVAAAALDWYEWSGDESWLSWAVALVDRAVTDLGDPSGGFFDRPREDDGVGLLAERVRSIQDSPSASPNGVAGIVLARLAALTGEVRWADERRRLLDAFADRAESLGLHAATYLSAMAWAEEPPVELVVAGPPGNPVAEALHRAALDAPLARRIVIRQATGRPVGTRNPAVAAAMAGSAERPAGYLCLGDRCLAPVSDPEAWRALLADPPREPGRQPGA